MATNSTYSEDYSSDNSDSSDSTPTENFSESTNSTEKFSDSTNSTENFSDSTSFNENFSDSSSSNESENSSVEEIRELGDVQNRLNNIHGQESDNSSDTASFESPEPKKPKMEDGLDNADANEKIQSPLAIALQPLDLVWARCKEGYSYPALIINPDMPAGFTQNGVAIPGPPREILEKRPTINSSELGFLVLLFDEKRSWKWIIRSKLQQLGMDPSLDKERLMEIREPSEKKAVRRAYEKAIVHVFRVNGNRRVIINSLDE